TTPTCSWADARPGPTMMETTVRTSTSRRSAAWRMSVREAELHLNDVTVVLEDGDVRGIEGSVVAEREGEIGRDRPLHGGGQLVDVVLPPSAIVRKAVRLGVVLVAEEGHELDAGLPPGREGDPRVDLVVAVAIVGPGARTGALATPLVAERRGAIAPVDRLTQARRVGGAVAGVLEGRGEIGDVAVAIEPLLAAPAGLDQRQEGRDERLARVRRPAERVVVVADLRPHPQLGQEGVADRPLRAVREQIEVLQPEVQVLVQIVLETDLRPIGVAGVDASAPP